MVQQLIFINIQTTQFVLASIYRQDDVIYTAQTGTEISNLSRKIQEN
jgi:hypothetical protein